MPPLHDVNPACTELFTRLTTIQERMLEEMKETRIIIFGNGKPGLKDDVRDLQKAHADLETAFENYIKKKMGEVEKLEEEEREKRKELQAEARDTRREIFKWRLAIAATIIAALITTAMAIIQAYSISRMVNIH